MAVFLSLNEVNMSRKNHLNTETVDYVLVEEFLDEIIDDTEPIPPTITSIMKQVAHKFGSTKRYTKQSLTDAVQTYYSERGWNPAAIRALKITMSNCSRDNSGRIRHVKEGWKMPEHQKKAVSKALKGCRFITDPITGKRRYVAPC
jgi:hypothetical protein